MQAIEHAHRHRALAERVNKCGTRCALVRDKVDTVDDEEAALHAQWHELLLRAGARHAALVHQTVCQLVGETNTQLLRFGKPLNFRVSAGLVGVADGPPLPVTGGRPRGLPGCEGSERCRVNVVFGRPLRQKLLRAEAQAEAVRGKVCSLALEPTLLVLEDALFLSHPVVTEHQLGVDAAKGGKRLQIAFCSLLPRLRGELVSFLAKRHLALLKRPYLLALIGQRPLALIEGQLQLPELVLRSLH